MTPPHKNTQISSMLRHICPPTPQQQQHPYRPQDDVRLRTQLPPPVPPSRAARVGRQPRGNVRKAGKRAGGAGGPSARRLSAIRAVPQPADDDSCASLALLPVRELLCELLATPRRRRDRPQTRKASPCAGDPSARLSHAIRGRPPSQPAKTNFIVAGWATSRGRLRERPVERFLTPSQRRAGGRSVGKGETPGLTHWPFSIFF